MSEYDEETGVAFMTTTLCAWTSVFDAGWKIRKYGDAWVEVMHMESGDVFRLDVTQVR